MINHHETIMGVGQNRTPGPSSLARCSNVFLIKNKFK